MNLIYRNAKYLILFLVLSFGAMHRVMPQQLVINEIMASNASTIADENGDFSDWIEIYNYGGVAIELGGYGLSDSYGNPFKWIFPDTTIQPGAFMVIWASGKNRAVAGQPLHTSYSISAAGEEIILTSPEQVLLDEVQPSVIPTDVSYGRSPDANGAWYFFDEPTPGASNTTQTYAEVLAPPVFSHQAGFYADPFSLQITHPDPEVTIVYTLDGSDPDLANTNGASFAYKNQYPQHPGQPFGPILHQTYESLVYNSPISIYDKSNEADRFTHISSTVDASPYYFPSSPVAKGFVVRAKAFKAEAIGSKALTATYFVGYTSNPHNLPLISFTSQASNLFDYETGIYTAGVDFDTWRAENMNVVLDDWNKPANYKREGEDWEFPAHIEIFNQGSVTPESVVDIGVRLHGNATRVFQQKSLRFYAKSSYGSEFINFKFFNELDDNQFKRLVFRNSGNDNYLTMFRDAACQTISRRLNFDTQAYQPFVVYVNGEYWGIHNARERYDKYYLARTYGVDPENIDLLTNLATVKEGSSVHFLQMRNFVLNSDLTLPANYEYLSTQMDMVNFADYQIAQIFARNTDWPLANIDFWRLKTVEYQPNAPYGHDGRWRWLMYDTDFGFGLNGGPTAYTHNTLAFATEPNGPAYPNPPLSTLLLRSLLTNSDFKQYFINRFADLLNTVYLSQHMVQVIDSLKSNITAEMPAHIHRWSRPISMSSWNSNVNVMINFANQRPFYQRQHIREQFGIESDIDVTLDVNNTEAGYIRINTITVTPETPGVPEEPYPWTGIYFHNIPIEVEAIAKPGYAFSHWTGSITGNEAVLALTPTANISLTAHFIEFDTPEPEIIHYWHFNTLSGTVTSVESDYSAITPGIITYPGTGAGYMDERTHRAQDPVSNLNLLMGQLPNQGAVLRVRNPSDTRELIIEASTSGFENIVVNFATTRTSNGAQGQEFYYSTDGGQNWVLHASYPVVELLAWELKTFDLSNIPEVNENPDLQFRILFTGSNAGLTAGNNRFDNFSVHGISTAIPLEYYSKASGDLYALGSWGTEPDGSGTSPLSFSKDNTTWYIHNRTSALLDGDWTVSGIGSKVVAGDGINPLNLEVNAQLNAAIDVSANATLKLANSSQPLLGALDAGSTVIFSGSAVDIPYRSYHHLGFSGINPVFTGNGNITLTGNMTLQEEVQMPDARGAAQYNILFTGNGNQLINTGTNVLRSYNLSFEKSGGSVSFLSGGTISSDNQLTLHFTGDATFSDNGITIYAGNSVNIGGDGEAYNFTGTLILAGTEAGIVNGSGSGNNFNIRETADINQNALAALNNLVIRVQNTGGEFRFRDGSTNTFTIKGNFIVESEAAGRIRFYGNNVSIGGNFIIEEGFSGTIDPLVTLTLNGLEQQEVLSCLNLNTATLQIDNPAGILLDAQLYVSAGLAFENGILHLAENALVRLGLNATAIGFGENLYINGRLGFTVNNEESLELNYLVGTQSEYLPFNFEVTHANNNEVVYIGRVKDFEHLQSSLDETLELVIENYQYEIDFEGLPEIVQSKIIIPFIEPSLGFDPTLLRIAKLEGGTWVNLGGLLESTSISSTESFVLPGIFALAKAAIEPIVPEYLSLQNINFPGTTDTCFAATATITLAGGGSNFLMQDGAIMKLVAGVSIEMLNGTSIVGGAWLWAYIDDTGDYCGQPESILAAKMEDATINDPISIALKHEHKISRVYPNPTSGKLTFEVLSGNTYSDVIIEVFNLMGERLMLHKISGENQFIIDLASVPSGMYLIRLNDHRTIQLERVVKH